MSDAGYPYEARMVAEDLWCDDPVSGKRSCPRIPSKQLDRRQLLEPMGLETQCAEKFGATRASKLISGYSANARR